MYLMSWHWYLGSPPGARSIRCICFTLWRNIMGLQLLDCLSLCDLNCPDLSRRGISSRFTKPYIHCFTLFDHTRSR